MSMMKLVTAAITARGPSTADDIVGMIPGASRDQVVKAMCDARRYGYLKLLARGKHQGRGKGSTPATYGPAERKEKRAPISSVWQLGAT